MNTHIAAWARRTSVRALTRIARVRVLRPYARAAMRRIFNQVAPVWDRIRADPVYRDATLTALSELPHHAPDGWNAPHRILDVACGTGLATELLVRSFPGATVIGIDVAETMIELAQRQIPDATFVVGSSFELPFENEAFDLVVSVDGVFDEAEIARVCAPGGAALIIYTKGGEMPVSQPVAGIATRLTAAGMTCVTHTADAWCIWAYAPAKPDSGVSGPPG